ncbi:Multidrug resistance protein 1A [Holothuria leucospilota]|uniref:Multidrug resistance protein 1A n=1 Tax=Holothuria leucospilota TaxID=206669 RepID=A0A9Q0YMN2_HOLLE|nr:Multidrug resistance protein 1A [Holothuria leucospilota]
MGKEDDNLEKKDGSEVEEKKDDYPEKDEKEDIVDPVVVQVLPASGGKGTAAANGAAATPTDAEKGGEKSDGDEKEKKEEEDKEVPPVGVISMFRFASTVDILLMLVGTLAALAHGSALPLVLVFFGDVVDAFIMTAQDPGNMTAQDPGNMTPQVPVISTDMPTASPFQLGLETINEFAVNYVYLGCGVLVVAFLQSACWSLAAEHQVRVIRVRFFRAILSQDITWFDERKGGELTTRISDDINKIRTGTGDKLGLAVQSMSTAIAGVIIGFSRSWRLALVVVAVSMGLVLPVFAISAVLVKKYTQGALDAYAKAGAVAEEVLSSIRTVTAFGGEAKELDRYSSFLGDAKKESIKKAAAESGALGGIFFVVYIAYAMAFWYGTILIINSQEFTAGGILITLFCVLFGSFSLAQAGPYFAEFSAARGAAAVIWEVIDQQPKIDCLSDKGAHPIELTGKITFEDVHFTYPTRKEAKVLQGFNLEVNVGQTVALVGSSGCGKSTTVALIQRYYDPDSGSVKLDDQDIRGLNVKWLRENIGVVSQEPILFGATIAENIRYGRMDVTEEEIHQAGKEANAHDFIMELPEQYNTLVGERGAQLSGGQKQRVAIARALVRNPKILLLDEATSALDSESEGVVQAALEKVVQAGRTTIVIAHRLSTIKNADMICAIQEGVVVEKGTHSELMDKPEGVYAQLVKQQQTKEVQEQEDEAKEEEEDEEEEKEAVTDNKMAEEGGPSTSKMKRGDSRHSGRKSPAKRLMSQMSVKSDTSEKGISLM